MDDELFVASCFDSGYTIASKNYQIVVDLLKNITALIKEVHRGNMCYLGDVFSKLTDTVPETHKSLRNRFVPSIQLQNILIEAEVSAKINVILVKLFRHILVQLTKRGCECAPMILRDFQKLMSCVLVFRPHDKNSDVDEIVKKFLEKLIKMISEFGAEDYAEKFRLIGVCRRMIIVISKCEAFSPEILKLLTDEVKSYYDIANALPPDAHLEEIFMENHLTILQILKEVVDNNVVDPKPNIRHNLEQLYIFLKNTKSKCPRENFLLANILLIVEFCLNAYPKQLHL